MITIPIQGMGDGIHTVMLSVPVENIEDMSPEFFGNVVVEGQIQKIGTRYTFTGIAECQATLTCDRSLTDYAEPIKAEIAVSYMANSDLLKTAESSASKDDKVKLIRDDQREIDITEEVREELVVNIPMKRIAPDYRDKELEDIFPEIAAKSTDEIPSKKSSKNKPLKEDEIDDRWAALKKLKFKN
ncbi:MAG: DUF177 domain-containing protein [Bacteroidota bacterium]